MRCEQPDETADPSFTARSSRWISHSTKAMLAQPFLHIATRLLTSYGQSRRRYFGRHAHGRPDLHSALALDRPQYRAYSCLLLTPASGAAKYLEGCTRRSRRRKPSKLHRAPNLLCRFHSANRKAPFLCFLFFSPSTTSPLHELGVALTCLQTFRGGAFLGNAVRKISVAVTLHRDDGGRSVESSRPRHRYARNRVRAKRRVLCAVVKDPVGRATASSSR